MAASPCNRRGNGNTMGAAGRRALFLIQVLLATVWVGEAAPKVKLYVSAPFGMAEFEFEDKMQKVKDWIFQLHPNGPKKGRRYMIKGKDFLAVESTTARPGSSDLTMTIRDNLTSRGPDLIAFAESQAEKGRAIPIMNSHDDHIAAGNSDCETKSNVALGSGSTIAT
ncbi:unnamed protein product [Amoebophrya sp. A120]|nr:unnamed protein product [Amoebophrya sp. A120]|eukprot:GSA120T00003483001.1